MKDNLIKELKLAAQTYYHGEEPIMTDEEYDLKLEALEEMLTDEDRVNPEIAELFTSPSAGTVSNKLDVTHDSPMLSLAKAKNENEVKSWFLRVHEADGFTLQAKLDGLALSALYEDGELVRLATRGDGKRGDNISYLIAHNELTINHLPLKIAEKGRVELRGEVFAKHSQFEVFNQARKAVHGEAFSNSRNAVSGMLNAAEKGLGYNAEITFVTYSAFEDKKPVSIDSLDVADDIMSVHKLTLEEASKVDEDYEKICIVENNMQDLMWALEEFGKLRPLFDIPTDGVVIKPTNEVEMLEKMGYTSHHPIAYLAYKYPGARATTVVEKLTVSIGKTGKLTPQAQVRPVEVDGVVITNLTCHNYNWLYEMGIKEGSTVAVTRANDVIPAIAAVIDAGDGEPMPIPTHCPECNHELHGDGLEIPKTLTCENFECPSRRLFYIKSIVTRQYLHIDGIGDVMLNALVNNDIVYDLYSLLALEKEDLVGLEIGDGRRVGEKTADNIIASIENAKMNTDSNKLLASFNVPGIGPNTAQKLIEHFKGFVNVLAAEPEDLRSVDGIGDTIVNTWAEHLGRVLVDWETVKTLVRINDNLPDEDFVAVGSFSVSGSVEGFANRGEFVKHMEALGWEFHKSPKADTGVLFADPNGTSAKIKKARANGTRIIDRLEDL